MTFTHDWSAIVHLCRSLNWIAASILCNLADESLGGIKLAPFAFCVKKKTDKVGMNYEQGIPSNEYMGHICEMFDDCSA